MIERMGLAHRLVVVRGLPASGKTTFAEALREAGFVESVVEEDLFRVGRTGRHSSDWRVVRDAVQKCRQTCAVRLALRESVAVANCFLRRSELDVYRFLAETYGAGFIEVSLFDGGLPESGLVGRSTHGATAESVRQARKVWQW